MVFVANNVKARIKGRTPQSHAQTTSKVSVYDKDGQGQIISAITALYQVFQAMIYCIIHKVYAYHGNQSNLWPPCWLLRNAERKHTNFDN